MQSNSQTQVEPKETSPDVNSVNKIPVPAEQEAVASKKKTEVTGVVTDCLKLNVRKVPSVDADVVAIIPALTEVVIDMDNSDDSFYKVCAATGIQGFCMKKYIAVRQ